MSPSPTRVTEPVQFESRTGQSCPGELTLPEGTARVPAVLLLQEWWGLNANLRSLAHRLAAEGFLVLTPDLYRGQTATDDASAFTLMQKLDTLVAMDDLAGGAAWLRAHPRCTGPIGVLGFCLGGALAFAAACHVENLGAVVPFYGIPMPSKVDYTRVTAPIQAHFATRDEHVSPAKAEAIRQQLIARGQPMELHVYEAGHAFMNDSRPEAYHGPSAELAWTRTLAFLRAHLGL